jgi:hypothetical protein
LAKADHKKGRQERAQTTSIANHSSTYSDINLTGHFAKRYKRNTMGATLPDNGPTGGFFFDGKPSPW